MRLNHLLVLLAFSLTAGQITAASGEEKDVTWAQLRAEVGNLRLTGRPATIALSSGDTVSSKLRRIEEQALVVEATPKTKKLWRAANQESRIPRAEVTAIWFSGRQGRHGMIGGLVGLGVGAAAAAAGAKSCDGGKCEGSTGGVVLLAIPAMGITGYLFGREFDRRIPRFHLIP